MNGSTRYQVCEVLHESARSRVCRGICEDTGERVILKFASPLDRDAGVISQLRHEHQILLRMAKRTGDSVALTVIDGVDALVRADHGGAPLAMLLKEGPMAVELGLTAARSIVEALDGVHRAGVVHKDINPSNILWHDAEATASLIDFGIAQYEQGDETPILAASIAAGTWAYAAPEQSGRMRRTPDERADLYAVGITLFEIFSGSVPFVAGDVAELIHAHLAVKPPTLAERAPGVPVQLSNIVAKLLEKEPEHRYQTASGLLADLQRLTTDSSAFPLGLQDSIERFDVPERLYGREAEIDTLLAEFDRARAGASRCVFVAGYSGIGKSALVRHIQQSVITHHCTFLSGKFDQLQRNVPFATLVQAFQGLIRLMLKESEQRVGELRGHLLEALGEGVRVVVPYIPELELIVGKQPPPDPLPPAEAHNRLRRVSLNFMKVFARPEHPLVLFLDDLQWADPSTLEMIELYASTDQLSHLLLIGAYRNNEVDATHPLTVMQQRLKQLPEPPLTIKLGPLPASGLSLMLADILRTDTASVASLAQICMAKTDGNPFFLIQFLRSLYDHGLIAFNKEVMKWEWMEDLIRSQRVQENVVDLMIRRVGELPQRTRDVLKTGACFGPSFDLVPIAKLRGSSVEELLTDVWAAVKPMFIVPLNTTQIHAGHVMGGAGGAAPRQFQFIHDRVQQAAYSLIGEDEKPALHLSIARLLFKGMDERELDDQLFDVVHHFTLGKSLLKDGTERLSVAELTLRAGEKARASAAFPSARNFAHAALALLDENSWTTDYTLRFRAGFLAAESAYLCQDFTEMERLAEDLSSHARDVLDRARIAEVRIQALMAKAEPIAAIHHALPILRELGVKLPANPGTLDVMIGMAKTEIRLRKFKIEDLLHLPVMTDPAKLAASRILEHVYSSAYFALPNLYPLIMFAFIRMSLRYGNTAASAVGYSAYGVILCGMFRQIERGNRFGKLSLDLMRQLMANHIKAKIVQVTQGFVTVWKHHPDTVIDSFLDAHQAGMECGDLEFASYTCQMIGFFHLWSGAPLEGVDEEMRTYTRVIERLQQTTPLYQIRIWHQLTANLLGQAANPLRMSGEHYEESTMLAKHREAKDEIAQFFVHHCKITLGLFYDDPAEALESAEEAIRLQKKGVAIGSTVVPIFHAYVALLFLIKARISPAAERRGWQKKAGAQLKPLRQWAAAAPMHGEARYLLVRAELAADDGEEMRLLHESEQAARKHRNEIELPLIHERLGAFYRKLGQMTISQMFFTEALLGYRRLQAHGVAERLIRQHPALALKTRATDSVATSQTMSLGATSLLGNTSTMTGSTTSSMVDVSSLVKATQALSGEIVLERLCVRFMQIMLENAGADRGLLALFTGETLLIEAEARVVPAEVNVLKALPVDTKRDGLPIAPVQIFNYVQRTQEPLVIDDAMRSDLFKNDPFVQREAPRSVICVPLQHQRRFTGILYLQNKLTSHAFPPDRAFMLQSLSSQAAISIENARLYGNLEALNRSYARFVPVEFLQMLDRRSITDVKLGDQVQRHMSVLFSDIQGYTSLSERMTPEENINFINAYLKMMEPVLHNHFGFIDKYIGDAIMALFPRTPADAVRAAVEMLSTLKTYNEKLGGAPLGVSIGINTGNLMLGVVGGTDRLDTTVISDAVNLAARIESLTRTYGISLLITGHTYAELPKEDEISQCIRRADRVVVKGKSQAVDVYEVFAADMTEVRRHKRESLADFNAAYDAFHAGDLESARLAFQKLFTECPDDRVVAHYIERCRGGTV